MVFWSQVTEIAGEQQMVIQFTCRSHRDANKSREFSGGLTSASFGQVGADRNCRATQLRRQSVELFFRKSATLSIKLLGQRMCLHPNFQIAIISQSILPLSRFGQEPKANSQEPGESS